MLHSHPEIEISFKFIPNILMSKECIHFLGHSVYPISGHGQPTKGGIPAWGLGEVLKSPHRKNELCCETVKE